VVARHDYLPFGEELMAGQAGRDNNFGPSDSMDQKVTGQMRDNETGLDFFNARYFGSALGRLTSPDPMNAGADLTDHIERIHPARIHRIQWTIPHIRIPIPGLPILRMATVLSLGCFLMTGCKNTERAWSAQAKSPDGRYVVTAETLRPGGWGTGAPAETTVDLNYTSRHQSSSEILTFVGNADGADAMDVGINWLTPTRLELTYRGHPTVEFQAVKCRGVDIITREADSRAAR
jgi:RHS repeat-associated protein